MRRISVVGNSGSGKSTLARELAAALGIPHLELDSVFHQPRWEPLPLDEFQRAVAAWAAEDGWVIDGNYSSRVQPIIWARADTVIWLDPPKLTVMRQVIGRTLRRAMTKQELWNGNREPLANFFSLAPEKSIISWAWHNHARYRAKYGAAASEPGNAHLTFIHLTSRGDVDRFLADPAAYARQRGLIPAAPALRPSLLRPPALSPLAPCNPLAPLLVAPALVAPALVAPALVAPALVASALVASAPAAHIKLSAIRCSWAPCASRDRPPWTTGTAVKTSPQTARDCPNNFVV